MKKAISVIIVLCLFLLPVVSDGAYLLRLKNGRRIITPQYWFEGKFIFFYCPGGTAGTERIQIAKIEPYATSAYTSPAAETAGKKAPPPAEPVKKETSPGSGKTIDVTAEKEEVSLEAYRGRKDQMQAHLDGLLEKQREAARVGDDDAKKKIGDEITSISKQIYTLTDEVTKKNEGKLPDNWWGR